MDIVVDVKCEVIFSNNIMITVAYGYTHCNISWIETSIPNIQNMTYVLQRSFMNRILQCDNNNSISRICQKERFIDTIMAKILYWFWVICAILSIKPARDIKMKRGKVFFFNFFILQRMPPLLVLLKDCVSDIYCNFWAILRWE